MPFKIVRNDITKMNTEAIVNTANHNPVVGNGCDVAIYNAAGYDELLEYREQNIGCVPEGEAFITPGFGLLAQYIIHAVSPLYTGGDNGEEEKLRSCYRRSFEIAKEYNIKSISFPLISTGSFGYPKEEGMRIAVDEINAFLLENEMDIYLVVFDSKATDLGKKLYPDLENYIDQNYVEEYLHNEPLMDEYPRNSSVLFDTVPRERQRRSLWTRALERRAKPMSDGASEMPLPQASAAYSYECKEEPNFEEAHESKLEERMKHLSDTFSQYLMYLIQNKNMENAEVYKRAIVDKKIFSKIKNNVNYHPQKLTALCLCVGAKLNLDESKDLLARAGYALSPCDKTDIIFSYFIENGIYDMIELDIQLEEHGLPCIIS